MLEVSKQSTSLQAAQAAPRNATSSQLMLAGNSFIFSGLRRENRYFGGRLATVKFWAGIRLYGTIWIWRQKMLTRNARSSVKLKIQNLATIMTCEVELFVRNEFVGSDPQLVELISVSPGYTSFAGDRKTDYYSPPFARNCPNNTLQITRKHILDVN